MDSQSLPAYDPARGPIRVVVEPPRSSWLGRVIKWTLTGLALLALIGLLFGDRYYGRESNLQEHWHSRSKTASDKIAIITVAGTILGDEGFVKDQIDQVRDDNSVRAVVLRVNSPGGTVTGSDYIYHHLKELVKKKEIPLVVSMGGIAASGGYYVSMAAGETENTIFAEPTTWTGSIGVIIPHYNVAKLLEKWDIADDSIASHPLKMMGSPTRDFPEPIAAEQQAILKGLVDSSFADFKEIVLAGRPGLRGDQAKQDIVFTGRIFTASQAKENGLVDKLGFVEDAIDRAAELAGIDKENVRVINFKQPTGLLTALMAGASIQQPGADSQPIDLR